MNAERGEILKMEAELREQCEQSTITGLEQQIAAERAAREQVELEAKVLRAEVEAHRGDKFDDSWAKQCEENWALEKELAALKLKLSNSIDQNDLLAALTRRGFEVSGLDGDESPEDIVASWMASEIQSTREKSVIEFTEAVLHGDTDHRAWLTQAAKNFTRGQPPPPPNGLGRAEAAEKERDALKLKLEAATNLLERISHDTVLVDGQKYFLTARAEQACEVLFQTTRPGHE